MTILVKFHRQKENFPGELTREPLLAKQIASVGANG